MTNPLVELGRLGQSIWYDFITRDLMTSGKLRRLIEKDGLSGMTSNPTIFEQAISGSSDYDVDIRRLATAGHSARDIFEALTVADVQAACDAFQPVYDATEGVDGLVSIEVSPTLAYESDATLAEAHRLWARVDRPNLMIKIPGTEAGLPAVEHAIADGVNVNVTLLFSVARHREVIDACLRGLERRLADGLPIDRIASVASFFVSRADSKIDPLLEAAEAPRDIRGTAAIANACTAYNAFEEGFRGSRWDALAGAGARVQRPLWASTSTKDPRLPDVYYVEALIAPRTVNTLPPATFEAYRDHGCPEVRLPVALARAPGQLAALAEHGIDLDRATRELEDEGVQKFADSYRKAIASIEQKASLLVSAQ
jgi:transaldolase